MDNEHLLNILKIIAAGDTDETIADRLYIYIESRGLMDLNYHPKQRDLYEVAAVLANTHVVMRQADSSLPYEYERAK